MPLPEPGPSREKFLHEQVMKLIDGVTYMQYWKGGRSQATMNEEATQAFVKLQTLLALERDVEEHEDA